MAIERERAAERESEREKQREKVESVCERENAVHFLTKKKDK